MSVKYLFVAVAILFATQTLFAQHKITGNLKDRQTEENLSGVSIYLSDLKTGVSTDAAGNFELTDLKAGNYLIEISSVGYNSVVHHYLINKDTTLNFKLSASHKELSEVVVTGVSRSTEIKQNPIIVKSLDINYLQQNSATNLIDALKNVPGMSQITTGAAISKPVIRGLGYNRVLSLLNGIRQEGQQWGDEHGIEIDEYAIDKIEIVKGPGSLMYGSDGIAGVVNFLSPKAPMAGQIKTQLLTNYQSNNNLIGYSLSNAGNAKGVQWLGRLSNKYAGNYQNAADGKVLNSGFKELSGNLFLGINKNWGHSHLHINSYNTTVNLPEGERDSLGNFTFENAEGDVMTATKNDLSGYKTGFPHQVINHLRISSNNYLVLKNGTLHVDLGFQNNKRKEYASLANPNDIDLFFDLNTLNYNARYNFEKTNGWETSLGIGGMQQSHTNRGKEYLIPNYHLFDVGAFVYSQKIFQQKWTLAGGLRFDNRTLNASKLLLDSLGKATNLDDGSSKVKFNAFKKNYGGASGSLGIAYQATPTSTIKLNVSRGFRAPNIAELASNGRHEGTFRYEIGDPRLKSEISHQFDLAYFLHNDHISFELTPFANFISNYIYVKKQTDGDGNEVIIDPADPVPAFDFAQGNAALLGGEIYLDVHPHPFDWLHIENSFSYVRATQNNATDSTKYLPFMPAPKYRGELKAELKKIGKTISNAYLKFGLDHFFSQNNVFSAYGTETATPAYTLLSAGIGGNIKAFGKKDGISLFVTAENIANISFQNHLSRLKYAPENLATGRNGIFNQGRNISLKMLINL